MAAKFVVVLVAMAVAGQCSVVPLARVDTDYSSFAYDVADPNTGDYKSQVETRSGGNVAGQYSLVDPDGTRRTVDYTADDLNGFNAVVRKDAAVVSAPVVAAAAPAVVAARVAAPVVAAAPAVVAAQTYAAPVVAAAPAVVAARTYAAPAVVARSYAAPAVYAASAPVVAAPSVYSTYGAVASSPLVARAYSYGAYPYSAYSAPLSYW